MNPKTRLHLTDMLAFSRNARDFLGDLDAKALAADTEKLFAVSRAVELIGEAATRVTEADRKRLPDIPWGKAIGMRNRIIHGYHAIDPEILVVTIRDHLPPLIESLERAIKDMTP
ncbi:MAG: DUF86 domain-containing protein [Maricaulaceae bacterium]|nr:DUF86 domain-containing protein [Maricaulaceae bacterium]